MAEQQRLTIDVGDQKATEELLDEIRRETSTELEAGRELHKEGVILTILATTTAIVSLAKVFSRYLQRRPEVKINIMSKEGASFRFEPKDISLQELERSDASLLSQTGSGESIDPVDPWPRR